MADKLNKKNSRNSTLLSFKDDDDFKDLDDKVTYVSTNKKTRAELIGSAPPNSRLAATLAQVAAAVQGDNLPRFRDDPARLTSSSSPGGQIKAVPATALAAYRDERDGYPYRGYKTEYRDDQRGYGQTQGTNNTRERAHSRERPANQRTLVPQQRPDDGYVTGTRHELDRKVVYHTKSENGELYVSAPTGSNEAQLFDEIAQRISKSSVSVV
jgi:hypothetical protein